MTRKIRNLGAFLHFQQRTHERIGPDVDAYRLWRRLTAWIENDSDKVQFVARVNKSGRRLWRFTVDGRPFFTIYDHDAKCPITVLLPEGCIKPHPDLNYQEINLEAHI